MKDRQIGVNCPPMHPFCRSVTVPEVSKKELKKVEDKGIIEESIAGVPRGKPMTFKEADSGNTNPNFS